MTRPTCDTKTIHRRHETHAFRLRLHKEGLTDHEIALARSTRI